MAEILFFYFIFALTSTIHSILVHFIPLVKLAKEGEQPSVFESHTSLSLIIWSVLYFLASPILIRTLLVDSVKNNFITQTYQATIAD